MSQRQPATRFAVCGTRSAEVKSSALLSYACVKCPKELIVHEGSEEQHVPHAAARLGSWEDEGMLLRKTKPVASPSREREKPHSSHWQEVQCNTLWMLNSPLDAALLASLNTLVQKLLNSLEPAGWAWASLLLTETALVSIGKCQCCFYLFPCSLGGKLWAMVYGLSSLLQSTAVETQDSTCRKAAHAHITRVNLFPWSHFPKTIIYPQSARWCQGHLEVSLQKGTVASGLLPVSSLGPPHQHCSPSPSGLPASPRLHLAEPHLDGAASPAGAAHRTLHGR